MQDNLLEQEKLIEVALLTTDEYLTEPELRALFEPALTQLELCAILNNLQDRWGSRGLKLIQHKNQWRFIVESDFFEKIPHLREERNPKYSKAVLETLAIVAYRQPITRAEIENIRGVSVSTSIIQILTQRGWIKILGYKDSIGKPALWGTTAQFLLDFKLSSLQELPPLDELEKLIDHPTI